MGIQVTRGGTNWTVDVTALGLVLDTLEKDFIVIVGGTEQPLASYAKTSATVITYTGPILPLGSVITFYRWGLRDVDQLEYGEVVSQLGMNKRLTQIERVLDDLREVKLFIWGTTDGIAAVGSHVSQADPHTQYRLKSANVPFTEINGVLSDAQIPALIARDSEIAAAVAAHEAVVDPHPAYTTAAELLTALTGYLPTSQKGAVSGIAPLDGSSKVPAINSQGCNASYTGATGVWTFTWADGATQVIDTPLEMVFQSVNYSPATKEVTFTLVGGATTSFSLTDLVDLPEVQVATTDPVSTPTTGQRLYFRSNTGNYWVSNGTTWVGPYLALTAVERTKLSGIQTGAQVNTVTSVAGKTGVVELVKSDVGLSSVDNTPDAAKPISTATATALNAKQPLASNLTAIEPLATNGVYRRTGANTADTLPVGATGAASMAADDPAEGRGALQLGTMSTQNADAVNITGGTVSLDTATVGSSTGTVTGLSYSQSSDLTDTGISVAIMTDGLLTTAAWTSTGGTQWIEASFNPANVTGVTVGAAVGDYLPPSYGPFTQYLNLCKLQYWSGSAWVDLVNVTGVLAGQLKTFNWPSVVTTKIRLTSAQYVGTVEFKILALASTKILPGSIQFNDGATQTASLRGSKTIGTPSITDTITVTGAEVGDIVHLSRGKDAFVSATDTVQFDSMSLSGVIVSAVVERFI